MRLLLPPSNTEFVVRLVIARPFAFGILDNEARDRQPVDRRVPTRRMISSRNGWGGRIRTSE